MRGAVRWLMPLLLCGCAHSTLTPRQTPFRLESVDGRGERIVTDVRIDGRPARLALDTGAGASFVLFAPAVARLGLKMERSAAPEQNPVPGRANLGLTAPVRLDLPGRTFRDLSLLSLEIPAGVPFDEKVDGLIGWPAISKNIWKFQSSGIAPVVDVVASTTVDGTGWIGFAVLERDTLALAFATDAASQPRLVIDTGSGSGVQLTPEQWRKWKAAHPDAPMTVSAGFMVGQEIAVKEVAWADEIHLGALVLHGVPVEEADAAYLRGAADGEEIAVLGIAALKRLDLIVDGRANIARVRALDNPPPPYRHNRVGAAFIVHDGSGDDLVAHVLAGGPAHRAGIRDGDILVSVNGRDVAGWRKLPGGMATVFNTGAPAGTKWDVAIRRGTDARTFSITAEELLGPGLQRTPAR